MTVELQFAAFNRMFWESVTYTFAEIDVQSDRGM